MALTQQTEVVDLRLKTELLAYEFVAVKSSRR